LVGIPEPDAEMASGEAVGEPLERVAPRELEEREDEPRSPKKHKSGTSRIKRSSEADVEELHQQMQEEVPAVGAVESRPIPAAGSNDPRPHIHQSHLQMLHQEETTWQTLDTCPCVCAQF